MVPVGSYPHAGSPYGVLDMSGNAAEWIADYFDPVYYDYSPQVNPHGPSEIPDYGLRGGYGIQARIRRQRTLEIHPTASSTMSGWDFAVRGQSIRSE